MHFEPFLASKMFQYLTRLFVSDGCFGCLFVVFELFYLKNLVPLGLSLVINFSFP